MNATSSAVAPSAPAIIPAVPAPSAAPAAPVQASNPMEHFIALAKADLTRQAPAPAPAATESPAAVPPVAPDPNAPPAASPAPAVPDPNAAPAAPAAAPVQTTGLEEGEEPEPTPEEQVHWDEGKKRLHGALVKERALRKEAKQESKQLKQDLEALKEKLEPKPATQPQPQPAAEPAAPSGALGDCHTFEAVDARATQAVTTEAFAMRLQNTLAKQGAPAVVEALKQKGITQIGGLPAAEVGEEGLSEFLITVQEGARITQTQADSRKRFLMNQAQAWTEAVKQVPELADPKSDRAKRFVQMANENPAIRNLGANWPVVLAYQVLGRESAAAKTAASAAPAAAAPVIKVTPTPPPTATRQVPAAPHATQPTPPKKSAYEEAAARVASGKANLADITAMARAGLATG